MKAAIVPRRKAKPATAAASPPSRLQTKIAPLSKLKSIGVHFSTVLAGEVYYRTFHNRRGVGQYIGLAPSPFQSGDMARDQGIAKAGNPRARKAMIELSWLWLHHQPDRERVGDRKGRLRRIAIVAMARKLAVALWRCLETGVIPEGAVLEARLNRPNSERAFERPFASSGMGPVTAPGPVLALGAKAPRERLVRSIPGLANCARRIMDRRKRAGPDIRLSGAGPRPKRGPIPPTRQTRRVSRSAFGRAASTRRRAGR